MLIIGLTGGVGSGKTTAANYFIQLGIPVIDADALSREVVEPGKPALRVLAEHFGDHIIDKSGRLDRGKLRHIVFADTAERKWLESVLHPLINQLMDQRIAECKSEYCVLMSPLLTETSQIEKVDRVLVIDVPESLQLERTMARDGNDEVTVKSIMASQTDRANRLRFADDIVINDRGLEHLQKEIHSLHERYTCLALE
jgi:dephospho-CoA kinase